MEDTFYPSCVIHLNIRFEQKLKIQARQANNTFNEEMLVTEKNTGIFLANHTPRKCNVHFQGHTQAATWSAVFDYSEFPVDPRVIAAATAEIYIGTVSNSDFSAGMQRAEHRGPRRSILKTRNDDGTHDDTNLVMVGVVDTWRVEHGDSGSEVHLEGRDLRGLLLDSPLVSSRDVFEYERPRVQRRRKRSSILQRLNTELNIWDLVTQILREHEALNNLPASERIVVRAFKQEWPNETILSPGKASHIPRHRRGASGQQGQASTSGSNMNFWDLITRYCTLVGAIPTFVGRELHIRYAPTLYSMISGNNQRVPFAGGQERRDETGNWSVRKMVYGRDIDSMKIARKYTGNSKPKTVRVVSVSQSTGGRGRDQMLESVWPPRTLREARREGVNGTNRVVRDFVGGQESSEIATFSFPGIQDQEQLNTIARAFYEQIGRNEITGEVSTAALTSFGGSNADPDLLRLRVGDPVQLLVDASRLTAAAPITSTLNRSLQLPFSEAVERLRTTTPMTDTNLARAVVASANGSIMGVLSYFRVSGAEYDWSDETVSVKFDIHNYWTPRFDFGARDNLHIRRRQNHVDHHAGAQASQRAAHATNPARTQRVTDRFMDSISERRSIPARDPRDVAEPDPFNVSERDPRDIAEVPRRSRWRR